METGEGGGGQGAGINMPTENFPAPLPENNNQKKKKKRVSPDAVHMWSNNCGGAEEPGGRDDEGEG